MYSPPGFTRFEMFKIIKAKLKRSWEFRNIFKVTSGFDTWCEIVEFITGDYEYAVKKLNELNIIFDPCEFKRYFYRDIDTEYEKQEQIMLDLFAKDYARFPQQSAYYLINKSITNKDETSTILALFILRRLFFEYTI